MRSAERQVTIRSATHPLPGVSHLVGGPGTRSRVYRGIRGRPLPCRKAMTAVPAVAGSFGRPGPGPVPRLSTPPRRDCPPGRLSASRAGGQTSIQPVRTSGVRPARRGLPGRVVGAEPDHGHIRMAYLACPRVPGTGTVPVSLACRCPGRTTGGHCGRPAIRGRATSCLGRHLPRDRQLAHRYEANGRYRPAYPFLFLLIGG
jgi:hypothetical protein